MLLLRCPPPAPPRPPSGSPPSSSQSSVSTCSISSPRRTATAYLRAWEAAVQATQASGASRMNTCTSGGAGRPGSAGRHRCTAAGTPQPAPHTHSQPAPHTAHPPVDSTLHKGVVQRDGFVHGLGHHVVLQRLAGLCAVQEGCWARGAAGGHARLPGCPSTACPAPNRGPPHLPPAARLSHTPTPPAAPPKPAAPPLWRAPGWSCCARRRPPPHTAPAAPAGTSCPRPPGESGRRAGVGGSGAARGGGRRTPKLSERGLGTTISSSSSPPCRLIAYLIQHVCRQVCAAQQAAHELRARAAAARKVASVVFGAPGARALLRPAPVPRLQAKAAQPIACAGGAWGAAGRRSARQHSSDAQPAAGWRQRGVGCHSGEGCVRAAAPAAPRGVPGRAAGPRVQGRRRDWRCAGRRRCHDGRPARPARPWLCQGCNSPSGMVEAGGPD